jgi:hypothetical protein
MNTSDPFRETAKFAANGLARDSEAYRVESDRSKRAAGRINQVPGFDILSIAAAANRTMARLPVEQVGTIRDLRVSVSQRGRWDLGWSRPEAARDLRGREADASSSISPKTPAAPALSSWPASGAAVSPGCSAS